MESVEFDDQIVKEVDVRDPVRVDGVAGRREDELLESEAADGLRLLHCLLLGGGKCRGAEQGYDSLNQHYTLFGQCDDASVDVVKAIARVQRDGNDKPLTPVVLKKVTIVREGQPLPPAPVAAPKP